VLDQLDLVVPAGVGGDAAAFGVAEAGVEARRLERMGGQRGLVTAAAADLLLGRGQEPAAQAGAALVGPDPEQIDVAAAAPGPAVQAAAQFAVGPAGGDAQQRAVRVAGRRLVERDDLGVEPVPEAVIASLTSRVTSSIPAPRC
jgi:hypothetical protein